MTKYEIVISSNFKKQYKRVQKQGKDLSKLKLVIGKLACKEPLDYKYKDHQQINDKYYMNC